MGCFARFLRRNGESTETKAPSKPRQYRPPTKRMSSSISLPPELILYIFTLAAQDSSSTACTLALLCSQIRDRVRLSLYTTPTLRTASQVSAFIKTVKHNPALAAMVGRLILDGSRGGDGENGQRRTPLTSRLPKVLERCHNLVELDVRYCIVFSLMDFGGSPGLQHLSLTSCVLSDRTTTTRYTHFCQPLPFLRTLSLHRVYVDPSTAEHFLERGVLPKLVALEVDGCRLIEDPITLVDLGPFEDRGLAAHLEILCISAESEENMVVRTRNPGPPIGDPYELVAKCADLRSLTVPLSSVSAEFLDTLPSEHLTYLTLLPPVEGKPDLFEPHLSAARALSTSFLALATSASSSLSTTPHHGRFALSSSFPTSLSVGFSPFSSANPSPAADAPRSPLSQLLELTLPSSWDVEAASMGGEWSGNSEFSWAVRRILGECEKREVKVKFGRDARDGEERRSGLEMMEEVHRARRAVSSL